VAAAVLIRGDGGIGAQPSTVDTSICRQFGAAGIETWLIDYRPIAQVNWPGPEQDVETAIRWARNQTPDLVVGVVGTSSGGQMAYEAGVNATTIKSAATDPANESALLPQFSPQPDFVIGISGPTDFVTLYNDGPPYKNLNQYIKRLVAGVSPAHTALAALSPALNLIPSMPPTMVVQGNMDLYVPEAQGIEMWNTLQALRGGEDTVDAALFFPGKHVLGGITQTAFTNYVRTMIDFILSLAAAHGPSRRIPTTSAGHSD
jgi:acetyl esterase/lipase